VACAQVHAKAQTDSGRIEEDEPAGGAGGGGQLTVFQSELLEAMRAQGTSPLQTFLRLNSTVETPPPPLVLIGHAASLTPY